MFIFLLWIFIQTIEVKVSLFYSKLIIKLLIANF